MSLLLELLVRLEKEAEGPDGLRGLLWCPAGAAEGGEGQFQGSLRKKTKDAMIRTYLQRRERPGKHG